MKNVLFHNHSLTNRGVTNSTVEYARHNRSILGNESALIYQENFDLKGLDIHSNMSVVEELRKEFTVHTYRTTEELNEIASKYDLCYSQRSGEYMEPIVTSTRFGVHSVFQYNQPHGDVYAYISKWLSDAVTQGQAPYVPYIVDLPEPNHDVRAALGISKDKFVYGRLGGYNTFDIPWVRQAIVNLVNERNDIVFIFANTEEFYYHENIRYLPPFFSQQAKSNYISACDAMIHARWLGESFGLSNAEFLFHNKPVLTWSGGYDRNHIVMLGNTGLVYDEGTIARMLRQQREAERKDYRQIVAEFSPQNVMKKFEEVFLTP